MKKVSVIGMDMGDKNHKAVGLSDDGGVVCRDEVPCTPEDVCSYLKGHPGALLAIETGTHCRWVSKLGVELGHEVLVGNARKLRMVRSRDLLVKTRTGIVNQIRRFCKSEGFRLPKRSAASFPRLEDDVPPAVREVAKSLFAVLKELAKKIGLYDAMIADALKRLHGEEASLLEPIAGAGPVTAAAFLAAVGDVATFGSARGAGFYFGLVPRQDQSGQTDRQLRFRRRATR